MVSPVPHSSLSLSLSLPASFKDRYHVVPTILEPDMQAIVTSIFDIPASPSAVLELQACSAMLDILSFLYMLIVLY